MCVNIPKDTRNKVQSPPATKQLVLIYAASDINSLYLIVQNNTYMETRCHECLHDFMCTN